MAFLLETSALCPIGGRRGLSAGLPSGERSSWVVPVEVADGLCSHDGDKSVCPDVCIIDGRHIDVALNMASYERDEAEKFVGIRLCGEQRTSPLNAEVGRSLFFMPLSSAGLCTREQILSTTS